MQSTEISIATRLFRHYFSSKVCNLRKYHANLYEILQNEQSIGGYLIGRILHTFNNQRSQNSNMRENHLKKNVKQETKNQLKHHELTSAS